MVSDFPLVAGKFICILFFILLVLKLDDEAGCLIFIIVFAGIGIATCVEKNKENTEKPEITITPNSAEKTNSAQKTNPAEKKEDSPKQSESERILRGKIQDIQRIRQELTQKRDEAVKAKEKYRQDVDLYKNEINTIREKNKISSYEGASGNHRISGNILLIQQRLAYIQSIEEIESGIEAGVENLITTERKIEGYLTYVKLLDKEKADQLLQEVTSAIDANKQYMGEFVIKIDESKLKSPEKIWDEILSDNL